MSGSFGIPKEMLAEIEKSKQKAKQTTNKVDPTDAESVAEAVTPDKPAESPKNDNDLKKLKEESLRLLEITFGDDDLWAYFFKGEVLKKDVCIHKDKLYATFRTISANDHLEIDRKTKIGSTIEYTEAGVRTLHTLHLISHGLIELGPKGKCKSIGETPEARFQELSKMGTLLVEKISQRWNMYVFLMNMLVREDEEVKKS